MSSYDRVAWFYDGLSRVVFGRVLVEAQLYLISNIPAGSIVLIAGGGTGWILEEIAKQYSAGLSITYVEASAKMMARSRRRNAGDNLVTFVCAPVEDAALQQEYDVVLTPFLFDNFTEETAAQVFTAIDRALKPGATWLYCDYQDTNKAFHKLLLWSMYTFFRAMGSVHNNKLPDMNRLFAANGYRRLSQKTFFRNFITSDVWQKE